MPEYCLIITKGISKGSCSVGLVDFILVYFILLISIPWSSQTQGCSSGRSRIIPSTCGENQSLHPECAGWLSLGVLLYLHWSQWISHNLVGTLMALVIVSKIDSDEPLLHSLLNWWEVHGRLPSLSSSLHVFPINKSWYFKSQKLLLAFDSFSVCWDALIASIPFVHEQWLQNLCRCSTYLLIS